MKKIRRAIYVLLAALCILCVNRVNVSAEETVDDDPGRERLSGQASQDFYSTNEEESNSNLSSKVNLFSITTSSNPYTGSSYTHNSAFDDCDISYGVDVSKYQLTIDWTKAKADGVDYAFIRAGYRGYGTAGALTQDTYFTKNMVNATAAGVKVGAYIFSQAITVAEAQKEAEYICGLVSGYDVTMPIVMDFEYASVSGSNGGRLYDANLSVSEATKICNAFCAKVKSLGYIPMLYANKSMLESDLDADSISDNYNIWLANYTTKSSYEGDYDFWQYSSTGSVDGISGNVDCNFWYVNNETVNETVTQNASSSSTPAITSKKVTDLLKSASTTTSLTLKWTKLANATGYEVYRANALDGTYSKVKTITSGSTVSLKQTGLTSAKQYYYKVRAYQTVNSKNYYSTYSKVLTAYTKASFTRKAVTKTSLKMRNTASTSATLVKTFSKGATLSVISFTYDKSGRLWYRVKATVSGTTYSGYMSGSYLSIYKYGNTTGSVNMRANAGTAYKVLRTVAKSTSVTIISSKKAANGVTWYYVKYTKSSKTYKGYICSTYVKLI